MADTLLRIASLTDRSWPLHSAAASRSIEAAALARHAPGALMERAGHAVARLALALLPPAAPITVFAGPGHNGGDGLVAALNLHRVGQVVRVWLVADAARLPADVAALAARAHDAGVAIQPWPGDATAVPDEGLVIDALLGLGTRRGLQGPIASAVNAINGARSPVLAVDLPTGLHTDTGAPLGDQAVRADHTLALLTLKPGLFTHQGRDHAGDVWFDSLGEPALEAPPLAMLAGRPVERERAHDSHKGRFGDVAVVGGAAGMTGAAVLAASAALAAGAGRVFVSLLDPAATPALRPELMQRNAWWLSPAPVLQSATAVCGCGGGAAVRQALPPLLSHAPRLVLDADALNAVADDTALREMLRRRGDDGRHMTVLTPHPLEAARLLASTAAEVQANRIEAAQRLAETLRCAVVLKGSGTVIAAPRQLPVINPTGNASLATAGTGDVLAGWIGGAWAQHDGAQPQTVAAAAVWQHGHAADLWRVRGQHGPLRAADLIDEMSSRR